MIKKYVLAALEGIGALMVAFAGLSGLFTYLFFTGRPSLDDPTMIWFAPLFFTPVAIVGVLLILASSLIAKQRTHLVMWSCLAFVVVMAATAAAFNLTGLSTGETALEGTFWGTAAITISVIYAMTMAALGVIGALVTRSILAADMRRHTTTKTTAALQ